MPSLADSIKADRSNYTPVGPVKTGPSNVRVGLEPVLNSMIRCPLPPIQATPDSLRQFYTGSQVPQSRLLPPASNVVGSTNGSGTVVQNTTVIQSGSSSSSSTTLKAVQNSLITPVLIPGGIFTGSILLAKSFQLLSITTNFATRVELYGTANAQSLDVGRAIDTAPSAGVFQNIISDVALDTIPYQWPYQNRIGANGDNPQKAVLYVTVTNIDTVATAITVTFSFVGLEQ